MAAHAAKTVLLENASVVRQLVECLDQVTLAVNGINGRTRRCT